MKSFRVFCGTTGHLNHFSKLRNYEIVRRKYASIALFYSNEWIGFERDTTIADAYDGIPFRFTEPTPIYLDNWTFLLSLVYVRFFLLSLSFLRCTRHLPPSSEMDTFAIFLLEA